MKAIKTLIIISAFAFTSCALPPISPNSPNPLDVPGDTPETVESIRREHMKAITGNPAYDAWNEMHEEYIADW